MNVPSEHFLIGKAIKFMRTSIEDPTNAVYDRKAGFWLCGPKGEVLVKSENHDCVRVGSKKKDIETGEDEKGE